MPATPSPKWLLVRPADGDFINTWPASMRAVVDWIDPNVATYSEESPRPAAGKSGRLHRAADGTWSFDTGTAWVEIRTGVVDFADMAADVPVLNVGDQVATARQTLPANGRFAWCDGSLIRRDLYAAFAAAVGDAYNGGVAPGNDAGGNPLIRLPNKAGRGSIGVGTATGAAGATAKARGARGGEETHRLIEQEMPTTVPARLEMLGGDWGSGSGSSHAAYMGFSGVGPFDFYRGPNSPGNNMQPYEVDNWMVRIS